MRIFRLILLVGILLVGQATGHAGTAFLLAPQRYHVTRNGYPQPERILPVGTLVKVLEIHGAKAVVSTSSGDTVTVSLTYLHMVPDSPSTTPVTVQPPAVATPPPSPSPNQASTPPTLRPPTVATPPSSATPSPSPNQAGRGGEKTDGARPTPPNETSEQPEPVRCSHITKKGEQCTRMTTSPNGLCWQHGGN